jgi:PEGA domain
MSPALERQAESKLAALLRRMTPYVALTAAAALALLLLLSLNSCEKGVGRPAVSLSLAREAKSPRDAAVLIDEEYIGQLGYVAARGVRLPIGKHRITIEKPGYFPWDRLVEADRDAIHFDIELEPIPD